jgi:hypothetical protein
MLASFRPPSSRGLLTLSRKAILRMWKCQQTTPSLAYMSTPPSGYFVVLHGKKLSTQLLQAPRHLRIPPTTESLPVVR